MIFKCFPILLVMATGLLAMYMVYTRFVDLGSVTVEIQSLEPRRPLCCFYFWPLALGRDSGCLFMDTL